MSNENEDDIKIYKHHGNPLKDKLGTRIPTNEGGHLDPDDIAKTDKIIADMCEGCVDVIGGFLEKLSTVWEEMKVLPESLEREEKAKDIFTLSHEIKDIASLCGYTLSAHFAESLRDYIEETVLNLKNQKIIIQAHIDAMNTVHRAGIKVDAGPAAEELKKIVKIAINRYK